MWPQYTAIWLAELLKWQKLNWFSDAVIHDWVWGMLWFFWLKSFVWTTRECSARDKVCIVTIRCHTITHHASLCITRLLLFLRRFLPRFKLDLSLLLLQSSFYLPLPLPPAVPSLGTLDGDRCGHTAFPFCSFIRTLFLSFFITSAKDCCHRGFQKCAIGGVKGIQLTRLDLKLFLNKFVIYMFVKRTHPGGERSLLAIRNPNQTWVLSILFFASIAIVCYYGWA